MFLPLPPASLGSLLVHLLESIRFSCGLLSFIRSLDGHLLSTHCVPDPGVGTGETGVSTTGCTVLGSPTSPKWKFEGQRRGVPSWSRGAGEQGLLCRTCIHFFLHTTSLWAVPVLSGAPHVGDGEPGKPGASDAFGRPPVHSDSTAAFSPPPLIPLSTSQPPGLNWRPCSGTHC